MAFFLRAFEEPGGKWTCRQGNRVLDEHASLNAALIHLREFAMEMESPVLIVAHWLGGRIEHLDEIEPSPRDA